jgi:glutathione peroxidase
MHHISINKLDGKPLLWDQFKDKKLLFVNVASECGFTPQYAQMEELYGLYKDKLEVIGVPCNDFGNQEPGDANEIKAFCDRNFGVTFTITEKVSIISNPHPLYAWLTQKSLNDVSDNTVAWNFHKFLVDEDGKLLGSFASDVLPIDPQITVLLD